MAGKIRRTSGLTQARLQELLHYDPETGIFTNIKFRPGVSLGAVMGSHDAYGYVEISVDGMRYKSHRLAWLYVRGRWPYPECDHEDRDRANNRWENLRECTVAEQRQNQGVRRDSLTGLKGVTFLSKKNRFVARIMVNGVCHYLGQGFLTAEAAHAAYAEAKARLHTFQPTVPVPA